MRRVLTTAAVAALLALPAPAFAQTFTTTLTGDAVVGGGDPDGSGFAVVTFDGTQVNYSILLSDVEDATGAHVHVGEAGSDGGVVIGLESDIAGGSASGTVSASIADVEAILDDPSGYYVQVHSTSHPDGAVRGQLSTGAAGGETLYFPVVAAVSGVGGGSNFLTDLRVVNTSGVPGTVTIEYYEAGPAGNDAPDATAQFPIADGEELVLDDVAASELGVTNGRGGMVLRSTVDVAAAARIYDDQTAAGEGTFGQYVRAVAADDELSSGLLPFLSNQPRSTEAGYRANIGWFNPGAGDVQVTYTAWATDGSELDTFTDTVSGWEHDQKNAADLFDGVGDRDDFYVTFTTTGGELFVYASVVDNVNDDAIYVAAIPAG